MARCPRCCRKSLACTCRLWRVADETQLIFANAHSAPVDAAALLHADSFVSGSQVRGPRAPRRAAVRAAAARAVRAAAAPPPRLR